jgi:hypothetical protein
MHGSTIRHRHGMKGESNCYSCFLSVYSVWAKSTTQWLLAALVHGHAKMIFSTAAFSPVIFRCISSVRPIYLFFCAWFFLCLVLFVFHLCFGIFFSTGGYMRMQTRTEE